jgi:Cof subfamily protein (haloacid dehalogenase superfamily)
MPTVVFLDLDATLWDRGVVPASAREAIAAAQQNGHKFLTNTGRARSEVPDLAYLSLDGYCFAAGAEVILDGQTLVDARLPKETVCDIMAIFDEEGLNYNLEAGDASWVKVNNEAAFERMAGTASQDEDPIMFMPRASEMAPDDYERIHKLFYHSAPSGRELVERLTPLMPSGVNLTYLGFNMAEATAKGVSKATAMEAVRAHLGRDWRTMALGDSDNDLSMLSAADVGICMGNGNDNAKAAADWITTDIHDDGLANALRHFGLI